MRYTAMRWLAFHLPNRVWMTLPWRLRFWWANEWVERDRAAAALARLEPGA